MVVSVFPRRRPEGHTVTDQDGSFRSHPQFKPCQPRTFSPGERVFKPAGTVLVTKLRALALVAGACNPILNASSGKKSKTRGANCTGNGSNRLPGRQRENAPQSPGSQDKR